MSVRELRFPARLVVGAGALDRLGGLAGDARRAFLVTDAGLVAAGHAARAEASLAAAGLEVTRFDGVRANPTADDVGAALAALGGIEPDLVVGLGGGSSLDVAKAANLLRAGGGRLEDYRGFGKARGRLLPMIAVPTTAGTGSEVQSYALIGRAGSHEKMACGDPGLVPRTAVLDPALTLTQPPLVTARTGLDALGHAVETAVTKARSPWSAMLASGAFRRIVPALPRVLDAPGDLAAREEMLTAAALAGMAIEQSMLGAAHALANPLTARHDVAHGHAVAMMLPHVVRLNAAAPEIAALYAGLARDAGLVPAAASDAEAAREVAAFVEAMMDRAGLARSPAALGVPRAEIPDLAGEAASQWTAGFNPRPVDRDDLRRLYETAFGEEGR